MFEKYESNVRSYCRSFPSVFSTAEKEYICDIEGKSYLDFLAGAGTLNYGHNNPLIKNAVIDYLKRDGIVHSLDLHTEAKEDFIASFQKIILEPRELDYKLQFTGPTGANAVEAALKLARKVTGRTRVVAFTGAFHGMTLGAMSVSAKESADGLVAGMEVTRFPFEGFSPDVNLDTLEKLIVHPGGIAKPAAFILETLQCEGGLNVASNSWLRQLSDIAQRHGILLIVDDIQVGCGRTGPFFSFERAGIKPDIVCLAKSIGGMGMPMALVLLKPELDIWAPGEHNGTFRGNNLAFVAGEAALKLYWSDDKFETEIKVLSEEMAFGLASLKSDYPDLITDTVGIGLAQGIRLKHQHHAQLITKAAFEQGIIVESCGPYSEVVKLMPPLIVTESTIQKVITILHQVIATLPKEAEIGELGAKLEKSDVSLP
ncbi:diaminobutyrate--2-oxoglutarate transaminase [Pseudoalteromonas denitrificans]|uniref:Diaminobutyrate--2-oxoglutarate transaminase n=1 Tax=Pseudoalteromonas denitrificans DSM 6059 TaxID=1123010 RepID=A0A1I1Q0L5_9GAMM|nr:diaminobutyrate--2-oxoglutarate transaminase [Pseudoalteromonas denitrificans]SFD15686.1 diaminobutyrate-2-oxoglutarate transaminase [Pseudoalteromonas denitrificans DSM 6059]